MGFFDRLFGRRRDSYMGPADRDWRNLVPQDVNRVPGDEVGRRRAVRSRLPAAFGVVLFALMGYLLWAALEDSTPTGRVALRFKTDGFLPESFVRRIVGSAPDGAARDVRAIKADLESDNQVMSADVRRRADGSLDVSVRERVAVARVALAEGGPLVVRIVSPDGRTFAGLGYPESVVRDLPEIRDFRMTGEGDRLSVDGLEVVGPFLLAARQEQERHYRQWSAVSLRDCFGAQEDAPGSNLNVIVRPVSQPADRPALVGIVFSTANWRQELAILPRIDVESLLRRPGVAAQSYVLKLSIRNRTYNPPVPEPRLVPVTASVIR
ncbi:MAG: cell division protein FtsQ/DivIB [Verrucomicrobiota bacterium]